MNREEKAIVLKQFFEAICPACGESKEANYWLCSRCSSQVLRSPEDAVLSLACTVHIKVAEAYIKKARKRIEKARKRRKDNQ